MPFIDPNLSQTIIENLSTWWAGLLAFTRLFKAQSCLDITGSVRLDGDKKLSRDSVRKTEPLVNHVITDLYGLG